MFTVKSFNQWTPGNSIHSFLSAALWAIRDLKSLPYIRDSAQHLDACHTMCASVTCSLVSVLFLCLGLWVSSFLNFGSWFSGKGSYWWVVPISCISFSQGSFDVFFCRWGVELLPPRQAGPPTCSASLSCHLHVLISMSVWMIERENISIQSSLQNLLKAILVWQQKGCKNSVSMVI